MLLCILLCLIILFHVISLVKVCYSCKKMLDGHTFVATMSFDIIYCDLWTSLILSFSGHWNYVLCFSPWETISPSLKLVFFFMNFHYHSLPFGGVVLSRNENLRRELDILRWISITKGNSFSQFYIKNLFLLTSFITNYQTRWESMSA